MSAGRKTHIHTDFSWGHPIIIAHPRRGETNAKARWSADRHFAANSETRQVAAHQMVSALTGVVRTAGSNDAREA